MKGIKQAENMLMPKLGNCLLPYVLFTENWKISIVILVPKVKNTIMHIDFCPPCEKLLGIVVQNQLLRFSGEHSGICF